MFQNIYRYLVLLIYSQGKNSPLCFFPLDVLVRLLPGHLSKRTADGSARQKSAAASQRPPSLPPRRTFSAAAFVKTGPPQSRSFSESAGQNAYKHSFFSRRGYAVPNYPHVILRNVPEIPTIHSKLFKDNSCRRDGESMLLATRRQRWQCSKCVQAFVC